MKLPCILIIVVLLIGCSKPSRTIIKPLVIPASKIEIEAEDREVLLRIRDKFFECADGTYSIEATESLNGLQLISSISGGYSFILTQEEGGKYVEAFPAFDSMHLKEGTWFNLAVLRGEGCWSQSPR